MPLGPALQLSLVRFPQAHWTADWWGRGTGLSSSPKEIFTAKTMRKSGGARLDKDRCVWPWSSPSARTLFLPCLYMKFCEPPLVHPKNKIGGSWELGGSRRRPYHATPPNWRSGCCFSWPPVCTTHTCGLATTGRQPGAANFWSVHGSRHGISLHCGRADLRSKSRWGLVGSSPWLLRWLALGFARNWAPKHRGIWVLVHHGAADQRIAVSGWVSA
jgi:hypothetical protein